MGLFDFLFSSKKQAEQPTTVAQPNTPAQPSQLGLPEIKPETPLAINPNPQTNQLPVLNEKADIPEDKFIEKAPPANEATFQKKVLVGNNQQIIEGIDLLYAIMQSNLEQKGLTDALTLNEMSYCDQYVEKLKADFEIEILKAIRFYEDAIVNLKMDQKKFALIGFDDTAINIGVNIEIRKGRLEKIEAIRKDLQNTPDLIPMIQTYKRGFQLGMYKLLQNKLDKQF